jgi:hypothetical protein
MRGSRITSFEQRSASYSAAVYNIHYCQTSSSHVTAEQAAPGVQLQKPFLRFANFLGAGALINSLSAHD